MNSNSLKEYEENCKENTIWLKQIIKKIGWPDENKVTAEGELCAWLIVQHSSDINFQKDCLKLLKDLPKTKERQTHIQYLTDRILVKEDKDQIYGAQNTNNDDNKTT